MCMCVCVFNPAGNKWELARSYKEVEQMCVSSNRGSSVNVPPPPSYPNQEFARYPPPPAPAPTSRGGTEGGVGPAVTLDARGVRSQARGMAQPSPSDVAPQVQGLKVALPPVTSSTSVDRALPIQMDGGRTAAHPAPQPASPTVALARATLDEKVKTVLHQCLC